MSALARRRLTAATSLTVPITLELVLVAGPAVSATIDLSGIGVVAAGRVAVPGGDLLWAKRYATAPTCSDARDGIGGNAGAVRFAGIQPRGVNRFQAWLILPGVLAGAGPVGAAGQYPGLLLQPVVSLAGGPTTLSYPADAPAVLCEPADGGPSQSYVAVDRPAALARGCTSS
jgi:hypothetical protein